MTSTDPNRREAPVSQPTEGVAATVAALNIADEYYKEQESSENLRRQLKESLEEGTRLKMELSEAKREIFKLQNNKK